MLSPHRYVNGEVAIFTMRHVFFLCRQEAVDSASVFDNSPPYFREFGRPIDEEGAEVISIVLSIDWVGGLSARGESEFQAK